MTRTQGQEAFAIWAYPLRRIPPVGWLATLSVLVMTAYSETLRHLGVPDVAVATVMVVGIAALASGIAGFAFSAICGAMLFQFRHDTVGVVEIMLICSIANQAFSVWLLRRDIRVPLLVPFVIGGIVGVPLGVWLLLHLNAVTFKVALGVLLVSYASYMLVRRPITLPRTSRASDVVSGFIGGMAGGFAATPGCGGFDLVRDEGVGQGEPARGVSAVHPG